MSDEDYNDGLDTAARIVEEMLGATSEGETILCGIESSKIQSETKNNMKDTHNITRTYYYDIRNINEPVPDYESMTALLLDEGIIYLSRMWDAENNEGAYLCIHINDYFQPAADAEDLPFNDIPKLFDLYRSKGYDGVAEYVALKRGIENVRWRDKLKDSNESDNLKKKYSEFNVGPFEFN